MSKERARRRAVREAERARAARLNEARMARRARRRRMLARLRPATVRVARQRGLLARRRRVRNALVAAAFALVQVLAWLLWASWGVSLAVLVLSLLFVPVIVTLAFDRRS
ncbi:hypothetical protein [Thermoactinospora rubra]|uniref:hypothetical protein n=1 Tax=Thermoactinospora rubra TaxID=1088767 RepID=UPI000A1013C6|nr:hypothetical protein [Thermoactinospora rubra]